MLHIHNGDSAANTLRESGLAGDILAFREVLTEGPAPLDLPLDEWFSTRARFLSDEYDLDVETCRKSLVEQYDALNRFHDHEEVIVWVGHDLLCQITLIYLLSWFARQDLGKTRLSLVCVNEFPGVEDFICLGQLNPEQLASLFDQRKQVTGQELGLADKAWTAYCSPNPDAIESLLVEEISALPYLGQALRRHLSRFPSLRNGLGHIGNQALLLISQGHKSFGSLFGEFGRSDPAFGLGDAQFWRTLELMFTATKPLLTTGGVEHPSRALAGNKYHRATFELTENGEAVLAGTSDFIKLNGVDCWLGGAHLTDISYWRWDELNQRLVSHATQ